MKKILSPIGRWQFFIIWFIVSLLFTPSYYYLILQVTTFLQIGYINSNPLVLLFIWFLLPVTIMFLAIFKRLIDIYGHVKKTIVATVFITISWFIAFFFLIAQIFNTVNFIDKLPQFQAFINTTNHWCYHIICITFFIYLISKKGLNNTSNLTVKVAIKRIVFVILICFILNITSKVAFLFNFMPTHDFRMCQTIDMNDTILSYAKFKYDSLKRFDVVTVRDYDFGMYNTPIRIIGLPNEKVEIKNNKIYINDKLIDDKYGFYGKKLMPININKTVVLNDSSYFLMGDNRYYQNGGQYLSENAKTGKKIWQNIYDEIAFVVTKDNILGKVVAINYKNSSKEEANKFGYTYNPRQKRNKGGIVILNNDKTLELNPSQSAIYMYGENNIN